MTVTGLTLYREVNQNGWQMAIVLLKIRNHCSRVWEWTENQQAFEYQCVKRNLNV